jgi:hypothetical protein
MLFAHGISKARSYVLLAEREKAALITSSKDVTETARVGAGINRTITPELVVGTPAAGNDTAVTPGLVVGTPPRKRRIRPADSARKRKEEKNAKEMIADQADVWDITKTPARSNIDNKGKRGSQNGWKNGGVDGSRDLSPPPSLVGGGGVRIGAPYPTIISTAGSVTTYLFPHDHQGHMKPPPPMTTITHSPPPIDGANALARNPTEAWQQGETLMRRNVAAIATIMQPTNYVLYPNSNVINVWRKGSSSSLWPLPPHSTNYDAGTSACLVGAIIAGRCYLPSTHNPDSLEPYHLGNTPRVLIIQDGARLILLNREVGNANSSTRNKVMSGEVKVCAALATRWKEPPHDAMNRLMLSSVIMGLLVYCDQLGLFR